MKDKLIFLNHSQSTAKPPCPNDVVELEVGTTVEFGPWRVSSRLINRGNADLEDFLKTKDSLVEWFDADMVSGAVEIRCRRDGDRFWPIGANSLKKVGRFLQDSQIDTELRKDAFVVVDAEKIIWLAPIRMAESTKVTSKTKRILEIVVCQGS